MVKDFDPNRYPDHWKINGKIICSPFAYTCGYAWFEDAWVLLPESVKQQMIDKNPVPNCTRWKFIDIWTDELINYLNRNNQTENKNAITN